jgi:hypothetical protein
MGQTEYSDNEYFRQVIDREFRESLKEPTTPRSKKKWIPYKYEIYENGSVATTKPNLHQIATLATMIPLFPASSHHLDDGSNKEGIIYMIKKKFSPFGTLLDPVISDLPQETGRNSTRPVYVTWTFIPKMYSVPIMINLIQYSGSANENMIFSHFKRREAEISGFKETSGSGMLNGYSLETGMHFLIGQMEKRRLIELTCVAEHDRNTPGHTWKPGTEFMTWVNLATEASKKASTPKATGEISKKSVTVSRVRTNGTVSVVNLTDFAEQFNLGEIFTITVQVSITPPLGFQFTLFYFGTFMLTCDLFIRQTGKSISQRRQVARSHSPLATRRKFFVMLLFQIRLLGDYSPIFPHSPSYRPPKSEPTPPGLYASERKRSD